MKSNKKGITTSIIATSLATIGFVSYKVLKNKYPDKFENFNKYLKEHINKKDKIVDEKSINISIKEYNNKETTIDNNSSDKAILYNNDNAKQVPYENDSSANTDENIIIAEDIKNYLDEQPNPENNIQSNLEQQTKFENVEQNNIEEQIKSTQDIEKYLNEEIKAKEDIQKHLDELIKNDTEDIIIPDNYIEDEIRYQLCLTNKEEITKNTLKKLERIDFFEIDDNDIKIYCDFLKKYTNIKSIVIDSLNPLKYDGKIEKDSSKHCLRDISPLNSLTSLTELSFNWGVENIDFSSLKDLNNLKKLEIKFGMLDNLDFISNLTNLEHLEIMLSNNVTDLTAITSLQKLKRLYLYTNKKLDTQILKNIKTLKYVYINGESINI